MKPDGIDLVVGGGVAGIAMAIRLLKMGRHPLLVEKRPHLGGRASSHVDPQTGELIDNGQHVILGCCTHALGLLKTLGTRKLLRFSSSINWALPGGKVARLERALLPAPIHYLPSLFLLEALSFEERISLMKAQAAILFTSTPKRLALGAMTFSEWLDAKGQSPHARQVFWEPIVVSALNEQLGDCSASSALDLFQRGFFPTRAAASIGVSKVSLRELIGEPAKNYLTTNGAEVRTGVAVRSLQLSDGKVVAATLSDGSTTSVNSVVLATPAAAASELLPAEVKGGLSDFTLWATNSSSAIICINLWFRDEVTHLPHAILTKGLPQWFFAHDVRGDAQAKGASQRLVAVISAANEALALSQEEILNQTLDCLRTALPRIQETELLHHRIVRETHATFSLTPRTEVHRIPQSTQVPNLHIIGDWTDSGWPATIEGAVSSAHRCPL